MENFFSSSTEVDGRFGGLGWDFSGVEGLSRWDWVISNGAESGTELLRHWLAHGGHSESRILCVLCFSPFCWDRVA